MQRPTQLPVNLRTLAANGPFMNQILELLESNLDEKKADKFSRDLVKYYFDLQEPADTHKIDALVQAINIIAIRPTRNENLIRQAETDLVNAFHSDDPNNFKNLMKNVANNVETKRPYRIPKESAPALPPLPNAVSITQEGNTPPPLPPLPQAVSTTQQVTTPSKPAQDQSARPKKPSRVPYLAKYTKEQSNHLQAIRDIRPDGKFDVNMANDFHVSQKETTTEANKNKGFLKAIKALNISPALEHLDKLAARAIKTGDQDALRNVAGYINEMKDLISEKKSKLQAGKATYPMKQLQVAEVTIKILELTEQKIEKVSQECKASLTHSDRMSRG